MVIKMKAKEKLLNVLKENKKLKEELKMVRKRYREQNEAEIDTQTKPTNGEVSTSDGTALQPADASQDDMAKKYEENEADVDTQATPKDSAPASDGTKMEPEEVGQNDAEEVRAKNAKMEQVNANGEEDEEKKEQVNGEEEEDKKEEQANGEDEEELKEQENGEEEKKFEEMEDDMGKVAEILEQLVGRVDALEAKVNTLTGKENAEEGDEEEETEPQPPISESRRLRDTFTEAVKTSQSDDFKNIAKNIIY